MSEERDSHGSGSSSPWRKIGSGSGSGSSTGSGGKGRIAPPRFSEGEIAGDRYRIVQFLGRGGMGEIYEAEDLDLEVRVALKTVRSEIADNQKALERFRREVQLARRVTHPNVCRLFDVGYHHRVMSAGDGVEETEDLMFLTMELLEGPTLAHRIRTEGPIPVEEAIPIVEQITGALDAAHREGVVHRDFKSSNIILVDQGKGRPPRAVVTDFGLARGVDPSDTLTSSFGVSSTQPVGTPTYMAPEQVAGREITRAVDIYALGVVMFEMITGDPPFVADSPLSTAVKRLIEEPPNPRDRVADLPQHWEKAILRCLERDPKSRFSKAGDVARALRLESTSTRSLPVVAHQSRAGLILIAIVIVAALLVAILMTRPKSPAAGVTPQAEIPVAKKRTAVAIIGFENLSRDPEIAWLSTAFSEMLSTELAAAGNIRIIPGANVTRMRQELSIASLDSIEEGTIERIGRNLGADVAVFGSYVKVGSEGEETLRLDVRMVRAKNGEPISIFHETGREHEVLDIVGVTGNRLRHSLGVEEISDEARTSLVSARPSSLEAARYYAEGIERLRMSDALGARDQLQLAVEADPADPLCWSALSEAWSAMGYEVRAIEAAEKAVSLSNDLSREERLLVDGRYQEASRRWDQAIEIYSTLWNFFRDNLEYGLLLAKTQTAAGRGSDAIQTIEALRSLPAPENDDPRIDLAAARAAEVLADFRGEVAAAQAAIRKGTEREAFLLVAEAYLAQGWAYRNLGDLDRAAEAATEARKIYGAIGDRAGLARALNAAATVERQRGSVEIATDYDEQSLEVFREIGDRRREGWALNNLGSAAMGVGELSAGRDLFEQSLEVTRDISDPAGIVRALGNIGNIDFESGRIEEATRVYLESESIAKGASYARGLAWADYNLASTDLVSKGVAPAMERSEKALAAFDAIGEQRGSAWTLLRIAEIRLTAGEINESIGAAEQARNLFEQIGDSRGRHYAAHQLAMANLYAGRLEAADREAGDALRRRVALGDSWAEALTRLLRAEIALARERYANAESEARKALNKFEKENASDPATRARMIIALARSAAGAVGAQAAIDALSRSGIDRANQLARIGQGIAITHLKSRGNRESLGQLAGEAKKLGYESLALEARFLSGLDLETTSQQANRLGLAVFPATLRHR